MLNQTIRRSLLDNERSEYSSKLYIYLSLAASKIVSLLLPTSYPPGLYRQIIHCSINSVRNKGLRSMSPSNHRRHETRWPKQGTPETRNPDEVDTLNAKEGAVVMM